MSKIHLSGIRVVVFDLDDTLYPERSFAFSGFDAVAEWLRARFHCPFDPADRMRVLFETANRHHVFDTVLAEMDVLESSSLIPQMVQCYREHTPKIELFPDAKRGLDRWSSTFHTGLISDGPLVMQRRKVEALALPDRLDTIILTDEWGETFWKPHPRAYETIEQASGRRAAACVYIADNAAKDFVAPRQLQWQTVRVCRPEGVYAESIAPEGAEAEFEVESLDEIDITS